MKKEDMIRQIKQYGVSDKKVLDAISKVDRKDFVLEEYKSSAYSDMPLPVGHGATISQPYTVAFMIEVLKLEEGNRVLEVGTASGWNAALISKIVGKEGKVITIEIVPELVEFAKKNLKKFKNVEVVKGDGSKGYEKEGPYDAIIVTAASPKIPKPLIKQLKGGGRLVIPVGSESGQELIKVVKEKGKIKKESLGFFIFVPLKGKYGFKG